MDAKKIYMLINDEQAKKNRKMHYGTSALQT